MTDEFKLAKMARNVLVWLITGAIGFAAATVWNTALMSQRDEIQLKAIETQIASLKALAESLEADQDMRAYRRWNLPDQQAWIDELQKRNPRLNIPPAINNQGNLNDELEATVEGK